MKIEKDTSFLDNIGMGILSTPPKNFRPEITTTMQFYGLYGP
jgi:hypothetical protein